MKNKILIGLAAALIIFAISVRFVFKNQFDEFKVSVQNYENKQLENFKQEKKKKISQLSNEDLSKLFNQYFDETKSIVEKDTIFSFMYLNGNVKYKTGRIEYLDCLQKKCVIDKQNEVTQIQIDKKEKELEKKFGNTFSVWYPKLKDEKTIATNGQNRLLL